MRVVLKKTGNEIRTLPMIVVALRGPQSEDHNLCAKPKSHIADTDWRGQNGKRADYRVRVKTPCAKQAGKKSKKARHRKSGKK